MPVSAGCLKPTGPHLSRPLPLRSTLPSGRSLSNRGCQRPKASRQLSTTLCQALPKRQPSEASVDVGQQAAPDEKLATPSWWSALPSRYQMVLSCSAAFVICNMDKVNMSVAIIPMAQDFHWSPGVSGSVHAAFFYGYMLSQLPGGYLASIFGGRKVLPAGVALWSGATCAVPFMASTLPGLFISRAAVGLGEAVAPSAAIDMVARGVPPEERSRAVSMIFAGLHVGSILGLLVAPWLIHNLGWPSVFYAFGAAGLAWALWFNSLCGSWSWRDPQFMEALAPGEAAKHLQQRQPPTSGAGTPALAAVTTASTASVEVHQPEHSSSDAEAHGGGDHGGHGVLIDANMAIPYRAFIRSRPVQALAFTHFAHNWLSYSMLAWLPTYFVSNFDIDLTHAAQTALFPPMAAIAATATAGPLADSLLARGMPLPTVRKLVQGISFIGPLCFLLLACTDPVADSRELTVACITAALGLSSFSVAGLYCTHSDMSPKYASALLGLTNTTGAIPGIIGVATVGHLYDLTQSWEASLFAPSALCMLSGALVYTLFAENKPVDFDSQDNSPFWWEKWLPRLPRLPFGGNASADKKD